MYTPKPKSLLGFSFLTTSDGAPVRKITRKQKSERRHVTKIKNNISSAKIKTLEEENKSLRDELQFFKNYAQRWNVNGENVTKIISKAYLNNNNND